MWLSCGIRKKQHNSMLFSFSKIKKEAKTYKGWDWSEVYKRLGIPHELENEENTGTNEPNIKNIFTEDHKIYKQLRDELDVCFKELPPWGTGLSVRSKEVLLSCRAYTYAAGTLKNSHDYKQPVWRGLSKVESDEEFIKLYRELFPYIWD